MARTARIPFSGDRLYALRMSKGMRQEDLSEVTAKLGRRIARDRISRYENGHESPSVTSLAVLMKALDCQLADLTEDVAA